LDGLCKATVSNIGNHWKLSGHGPILPYLSQTPCLKTFRQSQFVKDWEFDFHIIGSWETLRQELASSLGFAVSDGSYKTLQGATAWILEGSTLANQVIGKCFTPRQGDDHSSF